MKKFEFSLATVHKFKGQILDSLLNEMAVISVELVKQEKVIEQKQSNYQSSKQELTTKSFKGATILELTCHKEYLKRLQAELDREDEKLERIKLELENKKAEVVQARKENLSLDKLKEKKVEEYNKMVAKSEEIMIEEFVVNNMTTAKN